MNNYGFVLQELGLGPMLESILRHVLSPLSRILLPAYCSGGRGGNAGTNGTNGTSTRGGGGGGVNSGHAGTSLDSQHTFTIRYKAGEDTDLDNHMDQSAVTLNVCLGGEFEGADVYFKGP